MDEIVFYKPLTKDNIGHIVDLLLKKLEGRLAEKSLKLAITPAAKEVIISRGFDPLYGARPMKRYIQSSVETLLARAILGSDLEMGDTLTVDVGDGGELCVVQPVHENKQ